MSSPLSPLSLFQAEFGQIPDPRNSSQVLYPLEEILFLVLSGVISDCNTWEEIEDFGLDQQDWLRGYYPYDSGIPSSYTLNRVISMLDHRVFSFHFSRWMGLWLDLPSSTLINLDGKTVRGSKGSNGEKAVHLVNAFANDLQMVLGQVATEKKSNEITAIPELLNLLSIKGCMISIDAMGTQKEIANQIIEAEGDYLLSLKQNHPELYRTVVESFERMDPWDTYQSMEKNRSRIETRRVETLRDFAWIESELTQPWRKLVQVVRVNRQRENLRTGKVEQETRYYLLSREATAKETAGWIRGHWGVENRLHWRLDVLFGEDMDRKRTQNAAANFSAFRKMAQNLLLKWNIIKASIPRKRKMAARNPVFRNQIIQAVEML